mgnify:CR=1 FL=1
MATIREVAKKAGVSITTVSRILNNDDSFNVSKITKEKVLKVIKQLNYERKKNKNRISQSNISVIKCFDEKIENEDPYFVSLKINLENMLKKKVSKVKFFDLEEIEKLINTMKYQIFLWQMPLFSLEKRVRKNWNFLKV